jgi:nitrogen-specific signal transduction histidine kinase
MQARIIAQERNAAAAQMAHKLAHEINNPLQSMTNSAFLVAQGTPGDDSKTLGLQLGQDIDRLSGIVKEILAIPFDKA